LIAAPFLSLEKEDDCPAFDPSAASPDNELLNFLF